MRYHSLLFIFLSLMISCSQSGDRGKENMAYDYYKNGAIKTETEVINDSIPNGLMKNYYSDGTLKSVYTYVNGKREGPSVSYYDNGQLRMKVLYKDNKRVGTLTLYYKTGEKYRETPYLNGKPDGIRKTYYKTGQIMSLAPYKEGYPGLGLEEFNSKGEKIEDNTRIVVKPENRLAFENKYHLYFSLTPKQSETMFFVGKLIDGKYLHEGLWPVPLRQDGTGKYSITVVQGGFLMETLTISARYLTEKGSIGVVSRPYNLAVDNK